MMQEFSQRTIDGLQQHRLFRLLLPPFQSFLETNVRKEIEKDRHVIYRAAEKYGQGTPPDKADTGWLLQKAQEVDENFIRQAPPLSLSINIQYNDIEQIRSKRINQMLRVAYQLFVQWEYLSRFRPVLASLYTQEQFRTLVYEVLGLYITETRLLSKSVQVPRKLSFVKDSLLTTVWSEMETTAAVLADELAAKVYRQGIETQSIIPG